MQKTLNSTGVIFLLVGLGLIGGGAYFASNTVSFLRSALICDGTVVDIEEVVDRGTSDSGTSVSYFPVVRYTTADGQEIRFRSDTGSNPPGYHQGQPVKVLYIPANPKDARIDSFGDVWGVDLFLSAMGLFFAVIGGGFIYIPRRMAAQRQMLREKGRPIQTQIQTVGLDTSVTVNGSHPWRITSQGRNPSTGKMEVFLSEFLWFDPTHLLKGKDITVFLDRNNPKRYAMDTPHPEQE